MLAIWPAFGAARSTHAVHLARRIRGDTARVPSMVREMEEPVPAAALLMLSSAGLKCNPMLQVSRLLPYGSSTLPPNAGAWTMPHLARRQSTASHPYPLLAPQTAAQLNSSTMDHRPLLLGGMSLPSPTLPQPKLPPVAYPHAR